MTTTEATADFPLDDNIPATASKEMHADDGAAEASVLLPIPLDDDVSPSTTAEVSRYDSENESLSASYVYCVFAVTKTPDPADLSSATPNELQLPHSSRSDTAMAVVSNQCELCANYEVQLQLMQVVVRTHMRPHIMCMVCRKKRVLCVCNWPRHNIYPTDTRRSCPANVCSAQNWRRK